MRPPAIPDPEDSDSPIVQRVLNGDHRAYTDIVSRHEARLRRVVTGIVADRHLAEDVLQEVFMIAYRRLGSFRGDAPLGAWLYRIAVREARRIQSRWWRFWRSAAPLDRVAEERSHTPERPELDSLLSALRTLPPRERAAFILYAVEGRSYQEVAKLLSSSTGTVGSWIHRARSRLRAQLGAEARRAEPRGSPESGSLKPDSLKFGPRGQAPWGETEE